MHNQLNHNGHIFWIILVKVGITSSLVFHNCFPSALFPYTFAPPNFLSPWKLNEILKACLSFNDFLWLWKQILKFLVCLMWPCLAQDLPTSQPLLILLSSMLPALSHNDLYWFSLTIFFGPIHLSWTGFWLLPLVLHEMFSLFSYFTSFILLLMSTQGFPLSLRPSDLRKITLD